MHGPELTSKKEGAGGGGEESRTVSEEKNHLSSELMKSLRKHQIEYPATAAAIAKLGIEVRSQKTSSKWDPKSFEGKHRQEKWSKMVKVRAGSVLATIATLHNKLRVVKLLFIKIGSSRRRWG